MKRILLIATGGTIASLPSAYGLKPELTSWELCSLVPEIETFCQINTLQLLNIDSTNIQPEHWLLIARTIEENYPQYDGFVITHGTDTMAYTAAALTYLIQNPQKPIVLTGSQKPINVPDSGGRQNLTDSFRFACEDQAAGVFIVFCGQAILGTRARKIKTKSMQAFDSINYPITALIGDDRIVRYTSIEPHGGTIRFYHALEPKVFLLKLAPGIFPDILDYVGDRYEAIVIESYGSGGIPFVNNRNFLEKLEKLTQKGCVVLIATQVMLEGSNANLYEVGVRAIRQFQLLQAYDMTIEAVVTKLMWLLGQTRDMDEIRKGFYTPVAQDILTADEQHFS